MACKGLSCIPQVPTQLPLSLLPFPLSLAAAAGSLQAPPSSSVFCACPVGNGCMVQHGTIQGAQQSWDCIVHIALLCITTLLHYSLLWGRELHLHRCTAAREGCEHCSWGAGGAPGCLEVGQSWPRWFLGSLDEVCLVIYGNKNEKVSFSIFIL